jgi:phage terminase small subunit
MPRSSSAHLSVVVPADAAQITRVPRVRPPAHLTPAAAAEFRAIVGTLEASHFRASDVPLLAAYCMLIVASRNPEISVNDFLKIARGMALLATRLRLAPSTRGHHSSTNRQKMVGRSWEADLDDAG